MSALESLSNPLERLVTLPTTVNARKSAPGDIFWDSAIQYFANDLVISPLTGGAYIFTGDTSDSVAIRGGSDPALDPANWTRLQQDGLANIDTFATAAPIVGAANAYTLPAGASLTFPATASSQLWQVVMNGNISTAIATTAGDYSTFTFTANGAGATTAVIDIAPIADTVSTITSCGVSAVVTVGTGGTSIVPTGAYAGAAGTLATGFRFTYTRIA